MSCTDESSPAASSNQLGFGSRTERESPDRSPVVPENPLRSLPKALLGKVWPHERAVMGLAVSRWLREELVQSLDDVLLVVRGRVLHEYAEAGESGTAVNKVMKCLLQWHRTPIHLVSDGDSEHAVAVVIQAIEQAPVSVASVRISNTRFEDMCGHLPAEIAASMCCVVRKSPELASIRLPGSTLCEADVPALIGSLRECRGLSALDLSEQRLHGRGALLLAEALPAHSHTLRSLRIKNCWMYGNKLAWDALGAAIGQCCQLRELWVSNSVGEGGAAGLAAAVRGLRGLEELRAESCGLRGAGMQEVCRALGGCRSLRYLELGMNEIDAEGAQAMAGGLGEALEHLGMGCNEIGSAGAEAVAVAVCGLPRLQRLNLRENGIGDGAAQAVAGAVAGCGALREVDLSVNEIRYGGVRALAGALGSCRGLRRLGLADCLLDDEGAARLAEMAAASPGGPPCEGPPGGLAELTERGWGRAGEAGAAGELFHRRGGEGAAGARAEAGAAGGAAGAASAGGRGRRRMQRRRRRRRRMRRRTRGPLQAIAGLLNS